MRTAAARPLRWIGLSGRLVAGMLATAVALWGLSYLFRDTSSIGSNLTDNRAGVRVLIAHASLAGIALLAGPWQFIAAWRSKARGLHRWIGRIYACACLFGGLAGAALAWGTTAGPVAGTGFFLLAVSWMSCTTLGWFTALRRDFVRHRRWMIRSFALTFAAVTLRIYLPLSQIAGIDFLTAYIAIAWLCWVPNLIAVELWLRRHPRPAPGAVPA
ncbi:DUF2306 domain-containing protein [Novosphingobium sp. BL-8H]|uniref:DUF2306 domain-containing protein n=1 Tax=Novosphingobium sp. BL-8H TaxID=3127640 RepID=UPI003757352B